MAKPSKISKFFKNLLTVLLVLIVLCTLGLNLIFKDDNSSPFIFGNGFYVMQQVNMLDVSYGDVVISDKNKVSEVQPGNVVLCLTSYDDFKEVLRVQEIVQEDGQTYYMVKSDDPEDTSRKLSADKIVAKCTYTNSILGKIVSFIKSWQGIAILVGGSGLILVLMYITNYANKRAEELREEEERKARANQNRNKSRRPNPNNGGEPRQRNGENSNNPNRPKNPNPNRKPRNSNGTNPDANDGARVRNNKPIMVTQLSEEESIKQRQNVSNIIGSELNTDTQAREITREFNSAEVIVSQHTNFEAIKIHEGKKKSYSSESVHSPNMEQKAVEIKKALSQNDSTENNNTKPVMAKVQDGTIQPNKVSVKEPIKPIEPIKPVKPIEPIQESKPQPTINNNDVSEDKPIQSMPKDTSFSGNMNDTVIVIPTEIDSTNKSSKAEISEKVSQPVKKVVEPSKTVSNSKQSSNAKNIDKLINDDDNFLENLFESKKSINNDNVKVSDDILDELLSTIPSTHPAEKPVEHVKPEIKKPVHRTTTNKKTTHKSTSHKSSSKKVDNTSFNELLKAIEKEKNNIK